MLWYGFHMIVRSRLGLPNTLYPFRIDFIMIVSMLSTGQTTCSRHSWFWRQSDGLSSPSAAISVKSIDSTKLCPSLNILLKTICRQN